MKDFTSFLRQKHGEMLDKQGVPYTDDGMLEMFEKWLNELEPEILIFYAEEWGLETSRKIYEEATKRAKDVMTSAFNKF